MREPYPFKGVTRWLLLPTLLCLGGAAWAVLDCVRREQALRDEVELDFIFASALGGLIQGAALTVGPRIPVAVVVALGLGALSRWMNPGLLYRAVYGAWGSWRPEIVVASGVACALMVLVHHAFLRARLEGRAMRFLVGFLYLAAAGAECGLFILAERQWNIPATTVSFWIIEEASVSWLAMVLAARIAERTAPAGVAAET